MGLHAEVFCTALNINGRLCCEINEEGLWGLNQRVAWSNLHL